MIEQLKKREAELLAQIGNLNNALQTANGAYQEIRRLIADLSVVVPKMPEAAPLAVEPPIPADTQEPKNG